MTRRTRINPVATITDTTVVVTTLTGAAIVAAANSFGGNPGIVMLKPGATYLLNVNADQIVLPSNITLMLNGATIAYTGGTAGSLIVNSDITNGNTNISIVGPGLIDGGYSNHSGFYNCIRMRRVKNLTISNIEITNAYAGVVLLGDQHTMSRYVTLSNNNVHGCAIYGIFVSNGYRQVSHHNNIVHDCASYDPTSFGLEFDAAYIIDASEQEVHNAVAYGNGGSGIYIRNVGADQLHGLTAKRNGKHGIVALGLLNCAGSKWLSTTNSNIDASHTYHDILFSGSDLGYGVTKDTIIDGIVCGPLELVGASGAFWRDTAHPAIADAKPEAYALYVEDGVGTAGGDLRLLNVLAVAGTTGAIRYPATMGKLTIDEGIVTNDLPFDLAAGEAVMDRMFANGVVNMSTQVVRLAFFTARKTETITKVRTISGTGVSGQTLNRIGIYTVDANDNLTALVASTTNDTTLWIANNTVYTKTLTASFTKVRGQRYAVGVLSVGAGTPTLIGNSTANGPELAIVPRRSASLASQSDLPSSGSPVVAVGSFTSPQGSFVPYVALVP